MQYKYLREVISTKYSTSLFVTTTLTTNYGLLITYFIDHVKPLIRTFDLETSREGDHIPAVYAVKEAEKWRNVCWDMPKCSICGATLVFYLGSIEEEPRYIQVCKCNSN